MTVKEVAEIEKKNPETIRRWIRQNELTKHGYEITSFTSKKEGYQLGKIAVSFDIDRAIYDASERLNYHLKMADKERNYIKLLKMLKKA